MKPNSSPHYSITPPLRACLLAALLLSSFAIPHSSFGAESPLYIPFQGQVTNQAGTIVADGQYSVIFNLYDQAVGGQPVWSERHVKIGVTRGMINVFLGSISPLTSVDFSQTKYLGITVDTDNLATTADPEMVPRSLIIPAFFAQSSAMSRKMAVLDSNGLPVAGQTYGWGSIISNGNPSTGSLLAAKLPLDSIDTNHIKDNSIELRHLKANSVDSARIVNGSLLGADLSDDTIGISKFTSRAPVTGTAGVGNLAEQSNIGTSHTPSATWEESGLVVRLNVTGRRPVYIGLVATSDATGSNGGSYVGMATSGTQSATAFFRFTRDGTHMGATCIQVAEGTIPGSSNNTDREVRFPPSAFSTIDMSPAQGEHEYRVQLQSGNTWKTSFVRLVAFEL